MSLCRSKRVQIGTHNLPNQLGRWGYSYSGASWTTGARPGRSGSALRRGRQRVRRGGYSPAAPPPLPVDLASAIRHDARTFTKFHTGGHDARSVPRQRS